jgi:2-keto-4-pentenoate hydratase
VFESRAEIESAATALREAQNSGVACGPIRGGFEPLDLKSAYEIQETNVNLAVQGGRRIVGRKIGLTSKAVQAQIGVDQPDFGTLFADMCFADGVEISSSSLIAPRCEAEVAIVLHSDLDRESHTVLDVISATAYVLPALEIVDSRIADWDIRITDTVADNGSSALFVVGSSPVRLSEVDVANVAMSLEKNGELVSEGSGTACLGNPLNAAIWLADTLSNLNSPLKAGDVVLTGALGPMIPIQPGDSFKATMGALGTVATSFSK